MKTFYYFLSEQPQYPNKILANSKNEVRSLLMESLADESSISKILTEAEYTGSNNSEIHGIYADAGEYSNGNDFMNDVISSATKYAFNKENTSSDKIEKEEQHIIKEEPVKHECLNKPVISNEYDDNEEEPKYFEEAGINFKLYKGKVYKKVWKEVDESEKNEFRLVRPTTKKLVDFSKFILEKLDWEEI